MPANVRVWPCRLAPRAFMTNSEGTMSTLTDDLTAGGAAVAVGVGVWAYADTGAQSRAGIIIIA